MKTTHTGMQDESGNGWFLPMIPLAPDNFRGRLFGKGRLGIHPDGPSSGVNSHQNDGTEGCIGIQESNTADLAALFDGLTKSSLSISDKLYVEMAHKGQVSFFQETYSVYGNKPGFVSILLKE
jgi:hypothetical protein